MIQNDAEILQHFVENWEKVLKDYLSKIEDQIISRRLLSYRKVGEDVAIDIQQNYDRTGQGAEIVAKGVAPLGSGSVATQSPHILYQILDGFDIHQKDLALDPKLKNRDMEIIMGNVHRRENILAVNGDTPHNIPGIAPAAALNSNGVIASGDIAGDWDGSDTNRDIYNDLLLGKNLINPDRTAKFLLGNSTDTNWLFAKDDDNREPFWKTVCSLFGKTPTDPITDWLVSVGDLTLTAGNVYIVCYGPESGEIVISENPSPRFLPQQRGGNFPIELYEWGTVEIFDNDSYAKVATA